MNTKLGKAGRNRWRGIRPTVRGQAMNPVDHPLGGGEGRTSGGRHPVKVQVRDIFLLLLGVSLVVDIKHVTRERLQAASLSAVARSRIGVNRVKIS